MFILNAKAKLQIRHVDLPPMFAHGPHSQHRIVNETRSLSYMPNMNYDILVQIAEHLSSQPRPSSTYPFPSDPKASQLAYRTLYALSLVSKSCASAAAKILYRHIVISPESDETRDVLDLKNKRWRAAESEKVVSST